jgi:hypothetical protein
MHPSSDPQLSTLPRHLRGGGQSSNGEPAPVIPRRIAVETERNPAPDDGPAVRGWTTMKPRGEGHGLRRSTGGVFVFGALAGPAAGLRHPVDADRTLRLKGRMPKQGEMT